MLQDSPPEIKNVLNSRNDGGIVLGSDAVYTKYAGYGLRKCAACLLAGVVIGSGMDGLGVEGGVPYKGVNCIS